LKNACQDIGDAEAMHAFLESMNPGVPHVMVQSARPQTLGQMVEVANIYAAADDDSRAKAKSLGMDNFGYNNRKQKAEEKPAQEAPAEVNVAFSKGRQGSGGKWEGNKEEAEARMQHLRQNWEKLKKWKLRPPLPFRHTLSHQRSVPTKQAPRAGGESQRDRSQEIGKAQIQQEKGR
jgi:hypothetical protein